MLLSRCISSPLNPHCKLHSNYDVLTIFIIIQNIIDEIYPLLNHLTVLYHAKGTPSFLIRANAIKSLLIHMQKLLLSNEMQDTDFFTLIQHFLCDANVLSDYHINNANVKKWSIYFRLNVPNNISTYYSVRIKRPIENRRNIIMKNFDPYV